ncbi:MAG: hypothetical protein ACJAZ9_001736 [Neolewinella sp.]|jgi:hypothetical protein
MISAFDFHNRIKTEQSAIAAELTKQYERLALVRLAVFFGWIAGMIILFTNDWKLGLGALVVSIPLLAWGVRKHQKIKRDAAAAGIRADIATQELAALDHDYSTFDGGAEYLQSGHPYALDLDIFGGHSLFQFLNRTVTAPGRAWLAKQLMSPGSEEERARTQVQGKALKAMPDWCLEFRTIGNGLNDNISYFEKLIKWLDRPPVVGNGLERIILPLSPLFALGGIVWIFMVDPWELGVIGFLPAIWLLRKYKDIIASEHAYTSEMGGLLKGYADLLEHIETRPDELVDPSGQGAVAALRTLSYRISQLDVRYNPFVILLEVSGLWSLQWMRKLDQWRDEHKHELPTWLKTLAETDALISWANLRHNQPDWSDAEFTDESVCEAKGLGHPLLPPSGRITNDLTMRTDGHIHLVTGSNMAGKSTWLRTVGVNLVLAQAGGPVCALHLRTRPLQVWTSMRTQDDLSESTSSFYAELKRLKAIIEAVSDANQHVFFLLDEILKGTNSRDRHTGSRALIRQLIRELGAGIIATHDLELGVLESEPGSHVENYAMEVQTQGDDLVFDYKLHPGVCKSFNATALMARMGIDIPEEEIKLTHD